MKSFFIALLACLAVAVVVGELALASLTSHHHHQQQQQQEWTLFKRQHGKSYSSQADDARRFVNYLASKQRVERHNGQSGHSYKKALNHMADWTQAELAQINGYKFNKANTMGLLAKLANSNTTAAHLAAAAAAAADAVVFDLGSSLAQVAPPDELDWRQVPGRVGPVKNQGKCGSCWAFSTAGLLEGQEIVRNVKGGVYVDLSEQELLDCSRTDNMACQGGSMGSALDDLVKLGGIVAYKDYPYTMHYDKCQLNNDSLIVMTVAGHIDLPDRDEENLKKVLAVYGPISVALYASVNMVEYGGGILKDAECYENPNLEDDINHAVLLVGYGQDSSEGDYWIVKNSWGAEWGEQGYFKIARGSNMCGIALVPTIAKF